MKITIVELTQWLLSLNPEQRKVAIELIKEIGSYPSNLSLTDSDVMDILTPYLEDENEEDFPDFHASYP